MSRNSTGVGRFGADVDPFVGDADAAELYVMFSQPRTNGDRVGV